MSSKPDDTDNGTGEEQEKPRPSCICGIEIARARELCTERDCFYK